MLITATRCPRCRKEAVWPKHPFGKYGENGFPMAGVRCDQCGWYREGEMRPVGWVPSGVMAIENEQPD